MIHPSPRERSSPGRSLAIERYRTIWKNCLVTRGMLNIVSKTRNAGYFYSPSLWVIPPYFAPTFPTHSWSGRNPRVSHAVLLYTALWVLELPAKYFRDRAYPFEAFESSYGRACRSFSIRRCSRQTPLTWLQTFPSADFAKATLMYCCWIDHRLGISIVSSIAQTVPVEE